jgi:hypothetical protein
MEPIQTRAQANDRKVVRVESLDVIEDSYDLTVESKAHCFGLSVGVFVHNTDIKALRDLDLMYQRLFTALRTSPSIVGFTEDTPSSLGEGPTTVWNNNHARTAKVFQFSTLKAIKQIDLLYLRSRGYDVSLEDWNITVTAASTMEEESKRNSIKAGLEVFNNAFEAITKSGVGFNREYLTKELLQQAFAASPLDMAQLFDVEKKKNAPEPVTSSLENPLFRDRLARTDLLVRHGMITQEVFTEYKQQITAAYSAQGTSDYVAPRLISSERLVSTQRTMDYGEYLASGFLASADNSVVDLRSIDGTVVLSEALDKGEFKVHQFKGGQSLPLYAVALSPGQVSMSAERLLEGSPTELGEVYIVNGRYSFPDDADLANYLYIASSGLKDFKVRKVYVKA